MEIKFYKNIRPQKSGEAQLFCNQTVSHILPISR